MATEMVPWQNLRNESSIKGIIALLLTPFDTGDAIDWQVYDQYVDWQLDFKPSALFAVCGSSEMKWLTLAERLRLASQASQRAGSVPVIATANLDPDPSMHRDEISRMSESGVTGIVLVPPPFPGSDATRSIEYFLEMAEHSPVPVYLYEWPQADNYLLNTEIITAVSPYVSGIKDTTCTIEGIKAKVDVAGDMVVYQANTPFLLDSVTAGAGGYMAITSTCYADFAVAVWDAIEHGSDVRARNIHRQLVMLDSLLVRAYPMTAKYIVARRGIPIEMTSRWPVQFNPEFSKSIDVWMELDSLVG